MKRPGLAATEQNLVSNLRGGQEKVVKPNNSYFLLIYLSAESASHRVLDY